MGRRNSTEQKKGDKSTPMLTKCHQTDGQTTDEIPSKVPRTDRQADKQGDASPRAGVWRMKGEDGGVTQTAGGKLAQCS